VTAKDFEIKGGEVVGLSANSSNFEFGERYVQCRNCGIKRPGKELKPIEHPQGWLPVCKDGCRTIVSNP
jgi:hypothetical protein